MDKKELQRRAGIITEQQDDTQITQSIIAILTNALQYIRTDLQKGILTHESVSNEEYIETMIEEPIERALSTRYPQKGMRR